MFTINYSKLPVIAFAIIGLIFMIVILPYHTVKASPAPSNSVETNKVIAIDQLSIGTVTVVGNKEFSSATILSLLPSLKSGQPLDISKLSSETVFANSNPTIKINVDVQPISPSMANVVVRVSEQKTFRNIITFDNTGDGQTGKNRISYAFVDYNWLGNAQTAVFSYTRSPNNDKVDQFGFFNVIPLPKASDTLTISGSYSNTDAGTIANYFNIAGRGNSLGVHYNHNLKFAVNHQASINWGLDYRQFDNVIDFFGTNLGTKVTTLPISVAFQYVATGKDSSFNGTLGYSRNIGAASSNQDIFAATRVGSTANYSIWRQNAIYQKKLPGGWLLNAQLDSQYANTPLISGEEFGLGGSRSVRGFDERAITGDKGVRFTLECYTPEIAKGQRLLVFLDQGKYWLNNPQVGETPSGSIASYGIGWRLNTPGGTVITLDWAKVTTGTEITPEGTTKIHISASQQF